MAVSGEVHVGEATSTIAMGWEQCFSSPQTSKTTKEKVGIVRVRLVGVTSKSTPVFLSKRKKN